MNSFFIRRQQVMEHLGAGIAIFTSGQEKSRNNDVNYIFRQDSTFWYLTGFEEPNSVIVLNPTSETPYTMFVPPYDANFETWVGKRAGVEGAIKYHGADQAFSIEDLDEILPELLSSTPSIHFSPNPDHDITELINTIVSTKRRNYSRGATLIRSVNDTSSIISNMRIIKTPEEIEYLQKAINITEKGFISAFQNTTPGKFEYEIQADMESQFRKLGSPRNGYPSIVASGINACTLHYINNTSQIKNNDLLLIDAGAEFEFYTADITRTWPVNGKFNAQQLEVYNVVLDAQKKAIKSIKPGVTFESVDLIALNTIVQGLIDFNILTESLETIIEQKMYAPYYMHATSHWLGLDVHDSGVYRDLQGSIELREGMVLTVEPGLYFGNLAPNVPEQYQGIGIRIEDNILVTSAGHKNLSAGIPSDPAELEHIIGFSQ